ncbi:MAG: pentapeptide repeat-containing protein, partial [Chloroflexi bacterium]|nr:pentapeptide repeat-containing protein [Chloroflexota bacterium]
FEDVLTTFDPRVYALSDTAADWVTKLEAFAQRLEAADTSFPVVTFGSPQQQLKPPPPRIYIINGINSETADGKPDGNASNLEQKFEDLKYPSDDVVAVDAVYNTNLQQYTKDLKGTDFEGTDFDGTNFEGSHLKGTQFSEDQGGGPLGFGRRMMVKGINAASGFGANSINGVTSFTAWSANTVTDLGASGINTVTDLGASGINATTDRGVKLLHGSAGVANTLVGATEVALEYRNGENGRYTQEVYKYILNDQKTLEPGQKVILIGHSGGGALATNLSQMLERDGIDVQGVVPLGSPIANNDLASQYAKVTDITDKGDPIGQRWVRSEESRKTIIPAAIHSIANPGSLLPNFALFEGNDLINRDSNANIVNRWTTSGLSGTDAHGSLLNGNTDQVINIIRREYPEIDRYIKQKGH